MGGRVGEQGEGGGGGRGRRGEGEVGEEEEVGRKVARGSNCKFCCYYTH